MMLNELVNLNYQSLNESDLYIWKFINSHRKECSNLTIENLGKKCNVSRTTILRFAKKLGLEGFSELKYYLRKETKVNLADNSSQIDVDTMFSNYIKVIEELKSKEFNNCCELLYKSKRIFIIASGTFQKNIGEELKRSFLRFGVVMTFIQGDSEIRYLAQFIGEGDLLIVISATGENKSLIDVVKTAKSKGTKIMSLTRYNSNQLAIMADEPIYVFSSDIPSQITGNYLSTTIFNIIVECMFVRYYNYIKQMVKETV